VAAGGRQSRIGRRGGGGRRESARGSATSAARVYSRRPRRARKAYVVYDKADAWREDTRARRRRRTKMHGMSNAEFVATTIHVYLRPPRMLPVAAA